MKAELYIIPFKRAFCGEKDVVLGVFGVILGGRSTRKMTYGRSS